MEKLDLDETIGLVLLALGWFATVFGTYMSQGTWPAVAAFGLISVLMGMTFTLKGGTRVDDRVKTPPS
jgi:hypothetical protein